MTVESVGCKMILHGNDVVSFFVIIKDSAHARL